MNISRQIIGLDLVRFAAAVLVTIYHLAFWTWAPDGGTTKDIVQGLARYPEIAALTWFGWIGVQIFFVLSGFVIVYSAGGSAAAFVRSRVLRLVPAVWICATGSALVLLALGIYAPEAIAARYARTMLFIPKAPWVDGVYWTLGIEIAFYALIWLLLALRSMRILPLVLSILGGVSTLAWLWRLAAWMTTGQPGTTLLDALPFRLDALLLINHGCYFAIGGLLWAILLGGASRWLWLMVAVSVLGGAIGLASFATETRLLMGGSLTLILLPLAIWLLALAAIVLSVTVGSGSTALAKRARFLGLSTFPLYLIHAVIGSVILRLALEAGLSRWPALLLTFVAVGLLTAVVTAVLEPALRKRMKKLFVHPGWAAATARAGT